MPRVRDEQYYTMFKPLCKEERDKVYKLLLDKVKRKAVRLSVRRLSSKKTNKNIEDT